MRLFGRRQDDAEEREAEDVDTSDAVEESEDTDDDAPKRSGRTPRPNGPWDVSERDGAEGYVDLGAMRLRGREGMELRLDVEEASGSVTAATVQLGGSAVQLQAFAAPRSEGLWDEIRSELAEGIVAQGGSAEEQIGSFGPELLARVPVRGQDGRTAYQATRFVGVDGPRWFLRAVFHGAAVGGDEAAQDLESVVRDVVVVRGGEAMAPRELLTLHLPQEVTGRPIGQQDEPEDQRPELSPFRRGPEITEVR